MPNIIDGFIGWLTKPAFFGLPTWVLVVGFIIVLYILFKPKEEKFKRRNTKKEINKKFGNEIKNYGSRIKKRLDIGSVKSKYVIKMIPTFWDQNLKFIFNSKGARSLNKFLKNNPDLKGKDGKLKQDFKKYYTYQTCGYELHQRILASIGIGVKYMIVPEDLVLSHQDIIVLDPLSIPRDFFGITIYDQSGKEMVENICYRLNRENELDEFVNYIPKQNYLEVSTAGIIAKAREKAKIEKEKYKGQIEGAEG